MPWTKPEDLPFEAEDPIRAFGKSDFGDEFIALLADDSLKAVPYDTAPESLRALFTRAAGDKFDELAKRTTPLPTPASSQPAPLTIGMNDEFGMLFEGRLVAPAELSRRLMEALKENPDREVVIDLPKRPWTVAGHVDQLEQIARITGARWITRPAWSQIRIVFGVENSGQQTLDIQAPGYSVSGFVKDQLPNVREAITKNKNLPVQIEVAEHIRFSDPKIAEGIEEIRRVAEAAGADVRVLRTRRATDDKPALPRDALAVYTFEEDTFFRTEGRSRVRDVSGNGHDASLEDDQFVHSPDGKVGGALRCNRKVLTLPLPKLRIPVALLAGRDEYTMALWVRDSGKATVPSGKSVRTVYQEGFPQGANAAYPLSVNFVDQRMRIFSLNELVEQNPPGGEVAINGEVFTDEDTIPKDEWFFLALTLVKKGDAHVLRVTIDDRTTEHPFIPMPGLENGFGLLGGIDGMIDEVAFFGRAFTEREIETLRQHGLWRIRPPDSAQPRHDDQSIMEIPGLKGQAGSIERLAPARKLEGHTGPVKDVAYSPNGKWIASASGWPKGDQTLRIWDGSTGQPVHRLEGHTDNVTCVAFSPDSRYVASGSANKDKSIRLWDVVQGREVRVFPGPAYVDDLEISGDGEIVVALFAHELVVWDLHAGEERLRIALGETKNRGMALLSGQRALTGDDKGKVAIWDLKDGRKVGTFDSYPGFVDEFAVSPDGKTALVVGTGIGMLYWEIDTGRVLRRFPEATFGKDVGFSPDGRFAAVARIGSLQLFELETGKMWLAPEDFVGGGYGFWSVAFSTDGRSLVAGGGYGSNSADGKALQGDYALRLWQLPESVWPTSPPPE